MKNKRSKSEEKFEIAMKNKKNEYPQVIFKEIINSLVNRKLNQKNSQESISKHNFNIFNQNITNNINENSKIIKELNVENCEFMKKYKTSIKKDIFLGKNVKVEETFKNLIGKYKENGYKLENILPDKNIFQLSPLLMDNKYITRDCKYSNSLDNDFRYLEKLQFMTNKKKNENIENENPKNLLKNFNQFITSTNEIKKSDQEKNSKKEFISMIRQNEIDIQNISKLINNGNLKEILKENLEKKKLSPIKSQSSKLNFEKNTSKKHKNLRKNISYDVALKSNKSRINSLNNSNTKRNDKKTQEKTLIHKNMSEIDCIYDKFSKKDYRDPNNIQEIANYFKNKGIETDRILSDYKKSHLISQDIIKTTHELRAKVKSLRAKEALNSLGIKDEDALEDFQKIEKINRKLFQLEYKVAKDVSQQEIEDL